VRAMLTVQTPAGQDQYGLGFRLGNTFARATSLETFGHGGATGVVAWCDPQADLTCVLLTTRPAADNALIKPVSNCVAG
jgi:CubicO group peptidase (beta-lactamase class C family)